MGHLPWVPQIQGMEEGWQELILTVMLSVYQGQGGPGTQLAPGGDCLEVSIQHPRLCASRVYLCHWVRGVAFLGCLVFLIGLELSDWVHHEHHLFSCCHSHEWLLPGAQLEGPLAPTQAPLQLWRPL